MYTEGNITASDRRNLITKWCGNAWNQLNKESIRRGLKKCRLSTSPDGSENHLVKIDLALDYVMSVNDDDFEEHRLLDSDDSDEGGAGDDYVIYDSSSDGISVHDNDGDDSRVDNKDSEVEGEDNQN